MWTLESNKQTIYYAQYLGSSPTVDSNGFRTGEATKQYSDPIPLRINVSATRNTYALIGDTTAIEPFGISTEYTKTMVTEDVDCPVNETSILWIGVEPSETQKHNYVVVQVAKSINSIVYAIKEVRQ